MGGHLQQNCRLGASNLFWLSTLYTTNSFKSWHFIGRMCVAGWSLKVLIITVLTLLIDTLFKKNKKKRVPCKPRVESNLKRL